MIFSIVVILVVGVIGYFYFVQGVFTALLSAVSAMLAATLALSYFEPLTGKMFQGKFVDSGNAMALIGIFAVSFVGLRTLFDTLVPGNIRLQSTVDSVGGALMGAVVGIFTVGIIAIAAQSMPFGPSLMGQSRFKTMDSRQVTVPGRGQATDEAVSDELVSEKLDPNDRQSLLLPVDDWVVGFVSLLSNGGSLAGDRPLTAVHPSLIDEYFAQRVGIQAGVNHVIVNAPDRQAVTVPMAYLMSEANEGDAEIKQLRSSVLRSLKPVLKSEGGSQILVIRVMFGAGSSDTDSIVRFSPASIRLVINGVNYTPIGSLDAGGSLLINKADDALAVSLKDGDRAADMVWYVPKNEVLQNAAASKKGGSASVTFVTGAFLEVKREARIDLTNISISPQPAPDPKVTNVLRKDRLTPPVNAVPAPAVPAASAGSIQNVASADGSTANPVAANSIFEIGPVTYSAKLFHAVAVGLFDGTSTDVTFASGSAHVSDHQLTRCTINPVVPLNDVANADNPITTLSVPTGMRMVQIAGMPPARTDDPWMWATKLSSFALIDSTGLSHRPAGAFAKVIKSQQPMMMGVYESTGLPVAIAPVADARPTDVWLMFLTPDGTGVRQLDFAGQMLAPINLPG